MSQPATASMTSGSPFQRELERRVGAWFEASGRSRHGSAAMYVKTGVLIAWFAASYLALLLLPVPAVVAVLLAVSVGLAMAGIGFSVMHDANHGSYSSSKRVNAWLGLTLDFLGGSSFVWRFKHNVLHHSKPNVVGYDADISAGPLMRMAPAQKHRALHRFQRFYVWGLYALLPAKWQLVDDFKDLATGSVGGQTMPRPRARMLAQALLGKAVFFGWALALPMALHPVLAVLALYAVGCATLGVTLAVTFQLAHVVTEAEFPERGAGLDWATLQVATTVDFARGNRLLSWYLGGLNYQVEHHLFPKICHIHYPAISRIVEQTCRDMGLAYRVNPTLRSAVASHYRWLAALGRPPLQAA